jgi:predicted DNA-binding protein with PD1-like motif
LLDKNFKRGRSLLIRLDHGSDIIAEITKVAEDLEIETGVLSAIGALSSAELGNYDQVKHEYGKMQVEEPVELVSCSGNVSIRDGQPFVHAHAVLADRDGKVLGGHLMKGCVFAAEVYLQELLGGSLVRVHDPTTGLKLWGEE